MNRKVFVRAQAVQGTSAFQTEALGSCPTRLKARNSPRRIYSIENNLQTNHQLQAIEMADMGVKYDLSIAEKGAEEGKIEALKDLKDPGRQGTEEAKQARAYATTSEEDPPVEIMGDHHHHNRVMKQT